MVEKREDFSTTTRHASIPHNPLTLHEDHSSFRRSFVSMNKTLNALVKLYRLFSLSDDSRCTRILPRRRKQKVLTAMIRKTTTLPKTAPMMMPKRGAPEGLAEIELVGRDVDEDVVDVAREVVHVVELGGPGGDVGEWVDRIEEKDVGEDVGQNIDG